MNSSRNRYFGLRIVLVLAFIGFYVAILSSAERLEAKGGADETRSTHPSPTPAVRFDALVRGDFFAGMRGNEARLDRGMRFCEDILASNPKHADALVWHGGGLLTKAANAYRKGDSELGDALWDKGLAEMDQAVSLAPENIGILVGRSATLIGVAQSGWDASDEKGRELLKSALLDYEKVDRLQKPYFASMSEHNRGELLFGLASGWSILGDQEKARHYLNRVIRDVRGSSYEVEAKKWLEGKPDAVVQHDCRGCHAAR